MIDLSWLSFDPVLQQAVKEMLNPTPKPVLSDDAKQAVRDVLESLKREAAPFDHPMEGPDYDGRGEDGVSIRNVRWAIDRKLRELDE